MMPNKSIRIAIAGASGRMGKVLLEQVNQTEGCELAAALEHLGASCLGRDISIFTGETSGVLVSAVPETALQQADILIDFTRPEASMAYLPICARLGVKVVLGTTGFDEQGKLMIKETAQRTGIVFASNFSVGVNLTFKLLELAAKTLNKGFDVEIIEAHHRHKVDAPSGTALSMGEVIAHTLGRDLKQCAVYGREGITGERDPETIGFSTVRGGDIVGEHTVMFAGTGERIEIAHKASSRATFAQGAIRAAQWLMTQPVGLYDMQDVLHFR